MLNWIKDTKTRKKMNKYENEYHQYWVRKYFYFLSESFSKSKSSSAFKQIENLKFATNKSCQLGN